MAIYGQIVCKTCEVEIFIGKWLRDNNDEGIGFWYGALCKEGEADSHLLGKKVLRFIAKHMNHDIAIMSDDNEEYIALTENYDDFEQGEKIDDYWDEQAKR